MFVANVALGESDNDPSQLYLFFTCAFVIVKFTFVINGVISPISTWPSSILVVSQRVPSRLSKMDVCVESH